MEDAVRYQYPPLAKDNNDGSTRLLQLLPGATGEPIKGSIVNVNLCDNPGYEALSYCWGDTANTIRIYIGKEYIDVTRNLHDALVKLRDKGDPRTLWIDTICINQYNVLERSQQVGIMGQIYKQAKKTLVWLGLETANTARAFELIPYLLAIFEEAFQGKPRPVRLDLRILSHPSILRVYEQVRLFEPFIQLEQRPYFLRIWIIQEIALSSNSVSLFWGQYCLSWEEYFAAAYTFACLEVRKANLHQPLGAFPALVMAVLQLRASKSTSLISLLDQYRRKDSTDPRDKVFALLGIAGSKDILSLSCKVDYNMTVVEVYTNLASSYIQRDDNLDILSYTQCGPSIPGLPSWVPDWSSREDMPINFRVPNCSGIRFDHHAGGDSGCGTSKELWEEAKKHTPKKTIQGSLTVSTAEGSQLQRVNLIPIDDRETGEIEALLSSSLQYTKRRRFAMTSRGYYGLVPAKATPGDQIAILKGANYPFVLRAQGQSWKLVGECYVHGVMNGEAFDATACEEVLID